MAFPEWAIGAIVCVIGAIGINVGMNMQKLSHMRNAERPEEHQKFYLKQPFWWIGFTVFILGEILNFVSLGFASQTLLAVLGSFSLVANTITAPVMLGESLTAIDVLGTCLIIAGGALVTVYSDHSEQNYSLKELEDLYKHLAVVVFLVVCGLWLVAAFLWYMLHVRRKLGEAEGTALLPAAASMYAVVGSLMGAIGVLLAKSVAQLLKDTLKGQNQFKSFPAYGILLGFVVCGLLRIHYINRALQLGHALLVVPVYFVLSTVLTIVGGLVYFREYTDFTATAAGLFGLGVLLTLVGVFVIARNEASGHVAEVVDDVASDDSSEGGAVVTRVVSPGPSATEGDTTVVTVHTGWSSDEGDGSDDDTTGVANTSTDVARGRVAVARPRRRSRDRDRGSSTGGAGAGAGQGAAAGALDTTRPSDATDSNMSDSLSPLPPSFTAGNDTLQPLVGGPMMLLPPPPVSIFRSQSAIRPRDLPSPTPSLRSASALRRREVSEGSDAGARSSRWSVASERAGGRRRYSFQPQAFQGSFLPSGRHRSAAVHSGHQPLLGGGRRRTPSKRQFSVSVIGLGLS